jgi:hypothetical protein
MEQLRAEQKKLSQHQESLEERIRDNWGELRVQMRPANLAKGAMNQLVARKAGSMWKDGALIKGLLSIGAALLVKRMVRRKWRPFSGKK